MKRILIHFVMGSLPFSLDIQRITRVIVMAALFFSSAEGYAQQRDPNRKVLGLQKLEGLVHQLPYSQDYIQDTIIVEIQEQRNLLAPHYPDTASLAEGSQARLEAFETWLDQYPSEVDNYYVYLSNYIRTNKADQ